MNINKTIQQEEAINEEKKLEKKKKKIFTSPSANNYHEVAGYLFNSPLGR